ncbi:MAG: hypothetical protein WCQ57_05025 [Verrucomicrobiota bacterium]
MTDGVDDVSRFVHHHHAARNRAGQCVFSEATACFAPFLFRDRADRRVVNIAAKRTAERNHKNPMQKSVGRFFQDKMQARQIRLDPLESGVLKKANHILESCHAKVPLRTLDAIHTAACDLSQDFPLCTTDRRMRDAARMLKIPVFPVEDAD